MSTPIQYYPDLIRDLCDDHQRLIRQVVLLNHLIEKSDFKLVMAMLRFFKKTLLEHIHKENLKLYVYLQTKLPAASDEYKEMRTLRKEMNTILIQVIDFLNTYQQIYQNQKLQKTFPTDFENVTALLSKRICVEEGSLYTMYQS